MDNKSKINEFVEQYYSDLIIDNNSYSKCNKKKDNNLCLTEIDFYPPPDNRVLKSYIKDVSGGNNFANHCKDFFNMLEEEEYYD